MAFMMVYFTRMTTISLSVIGLAITIGRATSSLIPIFIGKLLDKLGPGKLSIYGDFISGIGFIICLFARDPFTIMFTQFLIQAGSHIYWTSNRGLVLLASEVKGTQTWFGLIASIRNIGLGIGAIFTSLALTINDTTGLNYTIAFSALLFFLSCIALFVWQPKKICDEIDDVNSKENKGLKDVLLNNRYRELLIVNFGLVLAAMVIPLVIIIYATEQLGLPPLFSGGLVILNTAIIAILSIHMASWAKKYNSLSTIKCSYLLNILAFTLFWCASITVENQMITGAVLVGAMIIYSLAETLSIPTMNMLCINLAPVKNNGSYMAAFQMTWSLGMTLSPVLFGWLMDVNKHAIWLILILIIFLILNVGFRSLKKGIGE